MQSNHRPLAMPGSGLIWSAFTEQRFPTEKGQIMTEKKTLSAKAVLADIRSGCSDDEIMKKYEISAKGFQSLMAKLVAAGILKQSELEARAKLFEETVDIDEAVSVFTISPAQVESRPLSSDKIGHSDTAYKLAKLKEALDAGLLNQAEFEKKTAELTDPQELTDRMDKLRALLDAGILSQEEYDQKKAELSRKQTAQSSDGKPAPGIPVRTDPPLSKSRPAMMEKPKRIKSLTTTASPQDVLEAIIGFARSSEFYIEAVDEHGGYVLLSEPMSLFSWGFYYPIYITNQSKDQTLVEVGIKSKVFQVGPVVSKRHEKCFEATREAVLAQEASVAARLTRIFGLKQALKAGTLSQAEYERKMAELNGPPSSPISQTFHVQSAVSPQTETGLSPLTGIDPYYLKIFKEIEAGKRPRFNWYAFLCGLVLTPLWYFYKRMWRKGLVYWAIAVVAAIVFELVTGRWWIGGEIAIPMAVGFSGNWDYYLYKVHGQEWWGRRSLTYKPWPENLPRRLV